MGRGKRIQDFRNLNLSSQAEKKEETFFGFNNLKDGKEFIIEVEEKPKRTSKNIAENKTKNKLKKQSDQKYSNPTKKGSKNQARKSSKTYIEKENEKRKKEERKKTSAWISAFLLTFIFVGVIAGCLVTPTFDVSTVIAEDGINIKSAEIQKYFSAVKGKNTFLVDTKSIEKELEKHPYVYKAEISRELPNRLVVKYMERKQYAVMKYLESYVFIDKYGSILETSKENTNLEIPVIYGIETENFIPGNKLEGVTALKFENVVYLLETARYTGFNYNLSEINYTNSEEVELGINEIEIKVIYGEIQQELLSDKITYLNEILKSLDGKKGTLDISSENYSEKVIFTESLK